MKKKYFFILLIFFLIFSYLLLNFNFFKKKEPKIVDSNTSEKRENFKDDNYNLNVMKDVIYTSVDLKGNEYVIRADKAEIDVSNRNILYLTTVTATIKLKNSEKIEISSDYGKYNSNNYDTIFSKNVIINYLYNKIISEYLDFSFERNSMIISKNVTFTNLENILKADVIEMNIKTKDTKIFMYENKKKVNIKNKN